MAGPTVGLWLFRPVDFGALRNQVSAWLWTFCDSVIVEGDGGLAFHVRDAASIALPTLDLGRACGFQLYEDDDVLADLDDTSELPGVPVQGLLLSANCSGLVNDRLLGHLALALSRRHDAWIDFGGLVGYRHLPYDANPEATAFALAEARRLVASLPGEVREILYDVDNGRRWSFHVSDADFLEAWLRHPDFRMIK